MQGNHNGHLNGHATHIVQIDQYLADYAETEIWPDGALPFLARYRPDAKIWNHILDRSADYHIFPLDVEKQVDEWRRAHPDSTPKAKAANQPVFTLLSDIQAMIVYWLWFPYIPLGKITLLEGDPEVGKTWLAMAVAACETRGERLPFLLGQPLASDLTGPHFVVYMQAEDGFADTLRPRFDALGGDPSRLILLHGQRQSGSQVEEPITLRDMDVIEAVMRAKQPSLLIIDPLQAYLGTHIDMHRANQTRPLMAGLARLADQYHCAILCIRHLSKARQDRAIYQGLGSIDIAAAARSVLLAGFHPDDTSGQQRVLAHSKSSLALRGASLGYRIHDGRFEWQGTSDISVAQLLQRVGDANERGMLAEAMQFLHTLLSDGPIPTKEVFAEARAAGLSEITLRRAKTRLGVSTTRQNREQDNRGRGQWVWQLQDDQ